jgi:hypothetical protein
MAFWSPFGLVRWEALYAAVAPSLWTPATSVTKRHHEGSTTAAGTLSDHVFTPWCLTVHTLGSGQTSGRTTLKVPTKYGPKTRSRRAAALV